MFLTDGKQSYGWLSILLHWIGAAFVIALFLLGDRFEDMPRGPEKLAAVQLHASVGITAFLFLAARILWRLRSGSPDLPPQRFALNRVAKLVQWLLLGAIGVLIVNEPKWRIRATHVARKALRAECGGTRRPFTADAGDRIANLERLSEV